MKKKEINKLTKDQALKNIEKLKKDLFNFRFQKSNGQLASCIKEQLPHATYTSKEELDRDKSIGAFRSFTYKVKYSVYVSPPLSIVCNRIL